MKTKGILLLALAVGMTVACKRKGCTDEVATNYDPKAKKDNGSCTYPTQDDSYTVPTTYVFKDAGGNSTVDYAGQTERLDQLGEMTTYMKTGISQAISAQALKDMFANTGGNGNGNFSFSSTKQLKDKCFSLDVTMFEDWMDKIAVASVSYASTASNGQAGVLTSGTSTYLFDENGIEYAQLIEKGLMGAVFMNQALNSYFSDGKMNVDNSSAVDPSNGKYYTVMEHHWDEAFGYFGVPVDFPTSPSNRFWGKYCMNQNAAISSNSVMMNNFLKGRAAIVAKKYADRDLAIVNISKMWEDISAYQAMAYLDAAMTFFGSDNAKYLHNLSETYAFVWNLRYAPQDTRRMTQTEVANTIALFGDNFWELTLVDLNTIKAAIDAKY